MDGRKLVVIMVGLPARGKTFLSVRLQRYLEWQGWRSGIFNVGTYRRALLGPDTSRSACAHREVESAITATSYP